MTAVMQAVEAHLSSGRVSRVIYGAIIGFCAARLAGATWPGSIMGASAAVAIGAFLVALKALLH